MTLVEPEVLVLAAIVFALTSVVQGLIGFGANLLAAPILTLLDTDLIPGPVLVAAVVLMVGGATREREHIDTHFVRWAIVGRVPGVVLGGVVLALLSDTSLQVLVGVTILVGVALSMARVEIIEGRGIWVAAGAVSGFGATSAAIGGPPVALVLQNRSGPVARATLSAFFVVGSALTFPAIAAAGRFGVDELVVGAALAPGALVGFLVSSRYRPFVDAGRLRPAVLAVSAFAGVALLVRVAA